MDITSLTDSKLSHIITSLAVLAVPGLIALGVDAAGRAGSSSSRGLSLWGSANNDAKADNLETTIEAEGGIVPFLSLAYGEAGVHLLAPLVGSVL